MSRANGYTSYRGSSRQARPSSADLVDLHVYIVPPDIWREQFNNLLNQNVTETISAGIIRVHPEVKVYSLREEIDQQIGAELLPQDYVFLKSVGRSITRLKPKQEYQLKAKHFIPPQAYAPELFLLEVGPGDSRGSTGPHSPSIGQPYNSQSYHHPENRERDHDHHHRERDRRHQDRSPHKQEKYDGTYTNHTNEDSGINVITPEEHYEALDRRKPEEHRQTEVHARLQPTHDDDDDERQRRLQEEREEWERRRREEEERRRKEEEEKRRREEEDQQREDDERRRREDEREQMTKDQKLTGSDEDLNRFPSPPPMQVHDIHPERETESAKRRRKEEKERLLGELEAAREARRVVERQREELVKKAKAMQSKTQNRRNHADLEVSEDSENNADKKPNDDEARDVWKKRYFEEKKRTPPLEEQCNRLRHELDIIHRKLMNTLEGPSKDKSTRAGDMKPSQKNNYKIQATRLTHEIDDMRRRLENAKMKLTAEMKLRNQAETELRALRAELTQKKIHLTLTRNQQLAALTPGSSNQDLYMMPALTPKS